MGSVGRFGAACMASLRYSRYLWTHIALTTIAGGVVGLLPFSLCLKEYAESLVSIPLHDGTASLSPGDWTERDREVVNQPAFLLFWLIKNTWCAVGEYMPMLLALHSGNLKTWVPMILAVASMVTVTTAETVPVWLWGNGWAYDEGIEEAVMLFKYLLMFLVNTLAVSFAESTGFRWASLLPITVLTGLPLLMHVIQDACIGFYLSHRTWYARLFISGCLMSVVRPVLLEVSLVASERLISLRGGTCQSRLGVYVAISCTALVHALQVSSDGPWETALVYSYMMFAEVGRNRCYLTGNTELTRLVATLDWVIGFLRGLFTPSPQEGPTIAFEEAPAQPAKPSSYLCCCLWQSQAARKPDYAKNTPRTPPITPKNPDDEQATPTTSQTIPEATPSTSKTIPEATPSTSKTNPDDSRFARSSKSPRKSVASVNSEKSEKSVRIMKSVKSVKSGKSVTTLPTLRSVHVAVTGDLVAISNVMEGALIVWISIMFLTVKLSPYEVAGDPLAWEVTLVNCLMGLFIEALTDFISYASVASDPASDGEVYKNFDANVGISADRLEFLWIFTVVLAISMETVGHMYEELCPTQVPGTTRLMSLSVCPGEA